MSAKPVELTSLLAYALAYASMGWHVFPVQPGGKQPIGRLARQGHLDATTDHDTIRSWWRAEPKASIGVAVSASGLCVIDVDPRNGGTETFDELQRQHGALTSDVMALTGGGGEHHVFGVPPGMHPSLPGSLGPGIDVKLNGYIVVEPSIHPSGKAYSWEASSNPLDGIVPSPLPDWLRGFAKPQHDATRTAEGKIPEGGRNSFLSRRAFAMRRAGFSVEHIESALALVNRDECAPPIHPDEVRRIAAGKARIAQEPTPYLASVAQPTGLVLDMLELDRAAGSVHWAVKGLIPERSLGFIFGASGTFKSFIALDYALHRTYGIDWLGRRTKQGQVVYLAAEGGAGLIRRIKAWHKDRGMVWQDCPMQVVIVPLMLRTESTVLREAITERIGSCDDLVVDTFSQTYTGNENSNDEVAEWMRTVGLELRDAMDCAVTVVHHTGHLATERPRGASAIIANCDYAFGVFRDQSQMIATVEFAKIKDAERPDDVMFELVRIELGVDEDGDIITSLVARWLRPAEVIRAIKEEAALGRGGHIGVLLGIIREDVTKDDIRRRFYETLPDASPEARRRAFSRAWIEAEKLGFFSISSGFVRLK